MTAFLEQFGGIGLAFLGAGAGGGTVLRGLRPGHRHGR